MFSLKPVISVSLDLFAWFWFGIVPGWYKGLRPAAYRSAPVLHTQHGDIAATRVGGGTAVLFDRRSIIPTSPAAPTAQMLTPALAVDIIREKLAAEKPMAQVAREIRDTSNAVADNLHKLGPRHRRLEPQDTPPPVDVQGAEKARIEGRVSAAAIDSPTALMRVLDPENVEHIENPCVACGKESTSDLLDRCDEHDKQILLVATTVVDVHSVGWVTGHTTGEFELLLERELSRTMASP